MDADIAREALREEVLTVRAARLPEEATKGGATTSTAEQLQVQSRAATSIKPGKAPHRQRNSALFALPADVCYILEFS